MATINTIIWISIILLVLFGIDCFIRPPKFDYGQTSGAAFALAVMLLCIYLVLNNIL
jgi:hypothetical protein